MNFKERISNHISDLVKIRVKISELQEFEKQWGELFKIANEHFPGCDRSKVRLYPRNQLLYFNYTQDKFHVLISDFYSLINAQIIDQKESLATYFEKELTLKESSYYRSDVKPEMIEFEGSLNLNEEEVSKFEEKINDTREKQNFEACQSWFKYVFSEINEDYVIQKTDIDKYKDFLRGVEKELKPFRHSFNHKYEKVIVAKYNSEDMVTLNRLEEIFIEYSQMINHISLIYDQVGNSFEPSVNYEGTIMSVIDLIVFGNNMAMFSFFDIHNTDFQNRPNNDDSLPKYYRQLRKNFFKGEKFKDEFLKLLE